MKEYIQQYVLIIAYILGGCFLFVSYFGVDSIYKRTSDLLRSRGLFHPSNIIADEAIANIIRIALGCILIYRLYYIYLYFTPLGLQGVKLMLLALYSALTLMVTIGFLTPIAMLSLLLLQLAINYQFGTYTLGVDVTAMALVSFILYPAGRMYSIDARLIEKIAIFRNIYSWFEWSDRSAQVSLAKLMSFLLYGYLCVYSDLVHLDDPSWKTADASILLLSSTYLSRWPYQFQWLFENYDVAVTLARFSMYVTIAWYFCLVPFVLIGGWLRLLAEAWTILFLLLSAFVLQLSTLPYIEFLLLIFWFWDMWLEESQNRKASSLNILFDDKCNLCDKTIFALKSIDLFRMISFHPISKNLDLCKFVGVEPNDLYKNIYAWDDTNSKVYSGYDFYVHVSQRIILLYPIYPILLALKLVKIGPIVYSFIARYRLKLFGVCNFPSLRSPSPQDGLSTKQGNGYFSKSFLLTVLVFFLIGLFHLPGVPSPITDSTLDSRLGVAHHILGITPIDVFNQTDLQMTYHFYTAKNSESIIPFTREDGSRDKWHESDKVYFGNSLLWRRTHNHAAVLPYSDTDMRAYCQIRAWSNFFYPNSMNDVMLDFYQTKPPEAAGGVYIFHRPEKIHNLVVNHDFCKSVNL